MAATERPPPSATERLPLSALLSQALVAFTIEVDNEFEHRMPHRTSADRGRADAPRGPWLVSAAMYWTCLRHLAPEGTTVAELERLARTRTNIDGMRRWRYLTIDPMPGPGGRKRPAASAVLRPTRAGLEARSVWAPLFAEVEDRWERRFGSELVGGLRAGLGHVVDRVDLALPDCLPILGYGLFTGRHVDGEPRFGDVSDARPGGGDGLALFTLLSRVLLVFAIDYEGAADVSLAIGANALRVLDGDGVRVRDLPRLTGVSKEGLAMAIGYLERHRYVDVEPVPGSERGRQLCLTRRGLAARESYRRLTGDTEIAWGRRFGAEPIDGLRRSLSQLAGDGTAGGSPLWEGLTPYPEGWRAALRPPALLPHFPMVLHRGGYPDGA